MSAAVTEAELAELQKQRYDRQIRVWGLGTINHLELTFGASYLHVQEISTSKIIGL